MTETALGRRHGLMRALKEKRVPGYRPGFKTARRNPRKAPTEALYRVTVLLPERWLVAPGITGIPGVTVEPEDFSGEMAVIEHRDLEHALRQMAAFLLSVANEERIMTANIQHDGVTRTQSISIGYDGAAMPRGSKPTIWVTR